MVNEAPGIRTLGVLLTLLATVLLPAHGLLHHHPVAAAPGVDSTGACSHAEPPAEGLDPDERAAEPCALCHQLSSGLTLASHSQAEGPAPALDRLSPESDVARRDGPRARARGRAPPSA